MKKGKVLLFLIAIVSVAVLLTGCLPPNYTKDHAKEVAEQHQQEAADWFAQNRPEAKWNKDCTAYASANNLYAALQGTYSVGRKTYQYVYDYPSGRMYLSEGYEEARNLIADKITSQLGLSTERCMVSSYGYPVVLISENDNPGENQGAIPAGDETSAGLLEMLPFPMSPEQYAEQTVQGENENTVYIRAYLDHIPEYDASMFEQCSNLGLVWYHAPIDCEKGFYGAYSAAYTAEKNEKYVLHIEKISDGLYGGYFYDGTEEIEDKLVFSDDGKEIHLEIPEPAKPIFFSVKKQKLISYFTSNYGKLVEEELEPLYCADCPGNNSYSLYSTDFMVRDNVTYGYYRARIVISDGKYDFRRE